MANQFQGGSKPFSETLFRVLTEHLEHDHINGNLSQHSKDCGTWALFCWSLLSRVNLDTIKYCLTPVCRSIRSNSVVCTINMDRAEALRPISEAQIQKGRGFSGLHHFARADTIHHRTLLHQSSIAGQNKK